MSFEEIGIGKDDQLRARRDAAMGAIEDALAPKDPMQDEVSDETNAKIDAALAQIQQKLGVSEEEAEVILAERWTQQHNLQQGE